MGKMGAGLALAIKRSWPNVYHDYMEAFKANQLMLGAVIMSKIISDQLYVANLCGQYYYGRKGIYTNYQALRMCFDKVEEISKELNLPVYIPYKIGCSLAGGDWDTVYNIIVSRITNGLVVRKQG
jgi:O-acetyl-ADP-ribose deacetylase (regulator of RNase III)